jgi:drug/metabolite transporter (DMT)-like permease
MWCRVWWGLLVVLLGSVCSGCAAVLQALAARSIPDEGRGLRAGLVLDLFRRWRFIAGLGLDLCSFAASTIALRVLPVFLVQAVVAANLAVTALVAWYVLGTHLRRTELGAVIAVCVGLGVLGVSAAPQSPQHGSTALHFGLLGAVAVIALLGVVASRLPGRWNAAALGLLAGSAFGLVNLSSRVLPNFSPSVLVAAPTLWAMPVAGLCALLFLNTAFQRESVVAASAGTILGQTIFPTAVGLFALGDHTRDGFALPAVVGFVVALAGTLLLTRFGDLAEDDRAPSPASAAPSLDRSEASAATAATPPTPQGTESDLPAPAARPE